MLIKQRTIGKEVSMSGVGIHTGHECRMTFKPAPENYGVRFIRMDLGGNPEIPAVVDHVIDISRGTTLGIGEAKVHTVEHVLAAVYGLQIDNLKIELEGIEPPIGDGSSLPYVERLIAAGFVEQNAPKDYLIIDQTVMYHEEDRGVDIVALPLDDYRITVMVDYQNPALGSQHSGLFDLEKEFVKDFAPARTFCFLSEVEMLANQGLIKGGDLENAVVIVDKGLEENELEELGEKLGIEEKFVLGETGILNNKQFRFKNEPVRHKLLDLIGDLALIGVPIKAQILAARPGHKANVEFARMIRKMYQQKKLVKKYQHATKEGIVFDINAISKILPHRYPFLLVDRIIHMEMDKKIVGQKCVSINEPFFNGHFPGNPIMPGVLLIESMAQTGGILLLNSFPNPEEKNAYFMQINNAKFRRTVIPGDVLRIEVEMKDMRKRFVIMRGEIFIDGALVAEADFTAAIVDRVSHE